MNKEVLSVEESEVILQFDTTLNHLQKQLELSGVNESFAKDDTEGFMLNFDGVGCCVHNFDFYKGNVSLRITKKIIEDFELEWVFLLCH